MDDDTAETTREKLPHELVVDILSRLPANNLWPLRCVCKLWFRLITSDPQFAQSNFDRSLPLKSIPTSIIAWGERPSPSPSNQNESEEKLDLYLVNDHTQCDKAIKLDLPFLGEQEDIGRFPIYGICNGMLCFNHEDKHEVYIVNPLTNHHMTIPYPNATPIHSSNNRMSTVFGFAYLQSANQYKVIKLTGELNWGKLEYHTHISMYTLGVDSSWRTVQQDMPYGVTFTGVPCPQINGFVHWLARKEGELPVRTLLAFDLKSELLYEIDPPINPRSTITSIQKLGELLCLFNATDKKDVDIWTMEIDGGSYSWKKKFKIGTSQVIGNFSLLIPLGVVAHCGDIILTRDTTGLITYNSSTSSINHLKEFGFSICNAHAYFGSIISPKVISGAASHIMV